MPKSIARTARRIRNHAVSPECSGSLHAASDLRTVALRSFARANDGAVATMFAVVIVPIVLSVGMAINYSRTIALREVVQSAADAAALAALTANPNGPSDAEGSKFLSAALAKVHGLSSNAVSGSTFAYSPATSTSGAAYQVTVAASVAPFLFPKLLGATPFSAQATASMKSVAAPTSAQIVMTKASGFYWKQIKLYVHNVGASSDSLVATYTYQMTGLNISTNAGVGTVIAQFSNGATVTWDAQGNLLSGTNAAVSLGSTYDKAYLVQTISPAGCPPGQTPDPTKPYSSFACIAAGSTVVSSNGQLQNDSIYKQLETFSSPACFTMSASGCIAYAYTVNPIGAPYTLATNDPATSNSMFVSQSAIPQPPISAVQIPLGAKPSITQLIPCGQVTYWALEDTPWKAGGLSDSPWQSQDLFFTIQGVQCAVGAYNATAVLQR